MGGTDDPSNLVKLTVEEHALAHKKLWEEHGKIQDLWAYQLLSQQLKIEEGFALVLKHNAKNTHVKCKNNQSGFWSKEQQYKNAKLGGIANRENAKKLAAKNNSLSACPHCNKQGQYRAMKRWHFENCKLKQPLK